MPKFKVVITETAVVTRTVEAKDETEAEQMVTDMLENGKISYETYADTTVETDVAVSDVDEEKPKAIRDAWGGERPI